MANHKLADMARDTVASTVDIAMTIPLVMHYLMLADATRDSSSRAEYVQAAAKHLTHCQNVTGWALALMRQLADRLPM